MEEGSSRVAFLASVSVLVRQNPSRPAVKWAALVPEGALGQCRHRAPILKKSSSYRLTVVSGLWACAT